MLNASERRVGLNSDAFQKPRSKAGNYEQVHSYGSRFGQDLVGVDVKKMVTGGLTSEVNKGASLFFKGLTDRLSDIFAGKRPPGWENVADSFRDGQLDLNSRLDLLSPLLDYGSAFMTSKGGFLQFGNNYGVMPFSNQLGPMNGCELFEDGIKLHRAGLWDLRCQLSFSNNALGVGNGRIEWSLKTYRPDGKLFSEQIAIESNQWSKSSSIISSVVVPEPGYVVKAEVAWIHGSREIYGGPRNNRLTVQHISNDTNVGATGSEESYIPDLSEEDMPIFGEDPETPDEP